MTQGSSARSAEAEVYRRWYKSTRWQQLRLQQLRSEPLCRACQAAGRVTIATIADHIRPHKGDLAVFMDPSNLQSLCDEAPWRCHSSGKQKEERAGFDVTVGADGWPTAPNHRAYKTAQQSVRAPRRA